MLFIKPGVKIDKLTPQMVLGIMIVERVYASHSANCTITSIDDGKHGVGTKHGKGCAVDFRTKDYKGDKLVLLALLKAALGKNFDVVLEEEGKDNEHIHVEYDPKP